MNTAAATRTRRRQTREQSRRQILAAADAILREASYRDLTIDAVMAETGLSRTVFYRHFADLPDLVLALMQDVGAPLLEHAEAMAAGPEDPERMRAGLERIVAFWAEHGPLVWAVSHAAGHDEEIEALYEGLVERFVDLTEQGLRRAAERGAIKDVDPRPTAEALTAMNAHYLLRTFGRPPFGDQETAARTLWTIWNRTLYR
jgi:TetR/AcrR family transcriptional regulator, ethionamide resistance regulator